MYHTGYSTRVQVSYPYSRSYIILLIFSFIKFQFSSVTESTVVSISSSCISSSCIIIIIIIQKA
jgi:hypothetical protein